MKARLVFEPAPDVVFRDLQGEAVILHLGTGIYFGLDEVGTRAWQLIVEHRPLAEVCALLAAEFDAPADRIERDITAFVDQLLAKDLLRAAS
jgi:hypothetical protein